MRKPLKRRHDSGQLCVDGFLFAEYTYIPDALFRCLLEVTEYVSSALLIRFIGGRKRKTARWYPQFWGWNG